jgi:hypothetical protein
MFLTFEVDHGEKLKETWLQEPGNLAMELAAWKLSREMRLRIRAGAGLPER